MPRRCVVFDKHVLGFRWSCAVKKDSVLCAGSSTATKREMKIRTDVKKIEDRLIDSVQSTSQNILKQ